MKKQILLSVFIAITTLLSAQTLPFNELFTAMPNPKTSSTVETAGGWTVTVGAVGYDTQISRDVTSAGLYYKSDKEYILSLEGNALTNLYTGLKSSSTYATKRFTATPITSGTVYLSVIVNLPALPAEDNFGSNGVIFCMSNDEAMTTDFMSILGSSDIPVGGAQTTPKSFRFGVKRGGTGNAGAAFSSNWFSVGTNHLLVLKYDFATQTASLYANPVIGGVESNETPIATDATNTTTLTELNFVIQRCAGTNKSQFQASGLRISTTWAEATAAKSASGIKESSSTTKIFTAGNRIHASEIGDFKVFNTQGVEMAKAINTNAINNSLAKGIYLVKFTNSAGSITQQKVVIQ